MLACLAVITAVFVSYTFSSSLITYCTERVYQVEIDTSAMMAHSLMVGLNTEGEGQIHVGNLSRQFNKECLKNNYDTEASKQKVLAALKQDWKNNSDKIFPLFGKKLVWAWQDDMMPIHYVLSKVPDSIKNTAWFPLLNTAIPVTSQVYYWLTMIGALVGACVYYQKRKIEFKVQFLQVIIFGYFALLLLIESQSRYKCLIMPYIFIGAAIGLQRCFEIKIGRLKKLKNKI